MWVRYMYTFYVCGNCQFILPVVITILKIKVYKPNSFVACMHKDNMKKLQGDYVSWLVLLTGAAQLLLVCGVCGVGTSLPGMFNSFCRPVSVMFHACRSVPVSGINQHHH